MSGSLHEFADPVGGGGPGAPVATYQEEADGLGRLNHRGAARKECPFGVDRMAVGTRDTFGPALTAYREAERLNGALAAIGHGEQIDHRVRKGAAQSHRRGLAGLGGRQRSLERVGRHHDPHPRASLLSWPSVARLAAVRRRA